MRTRLPRLFLLFTLLPLLVLGSLYSAFASSSGAPTGYLITNDDLAGRTKGNSATFFTVAADGTLSNPTKVTVGGAGSGGGFFAANRVSVSSSASSPCVYLSQ